MSQTKSNETTKYLGNCGNIHHGCLLSKRGWTQDFSDRYSIQIIIFIIDMASVFE